MGPRPSRRAFLTAAATVTTAGCVSGVAREAEPVDVPPVDVPSYHGAAGRPGATASPGPEGLIEEKWAAPVRGEARAPPALADGVAYVNDGEQSLYALDARDGTERWRADVGGDGHLEAGGTPTVADGTVYATSGDGLVAVTARDGAKQWRVDEFAEGTPAVTDDRVFFGDGHGLYAATCAGDVQWWYEEGADRLESPSLHPTPTAASGLVHVGVDDRATLTNHTVYAFGPGGRPAWTTRTGYAAHTAATVANDTVYYGARDHSSGEHDAVLALDAGTGEVVWERHFGGRGIAKPTAAGGTVYAGTPVGVFALDAADGSVEWAFERDRSELDRYELSDTAPVEAASPVVAENALYVPARVEDGAYLYALSAADGARLWRRGGGYRDPVPVGGTVYATRGAGSVFGPDGLLTALGEYRRGR